VPCANEVHITVTAAATAIPAGLQRIDITADGTELSCAFTLPSIRAGEVMGTLAAQCQPGLTADIGPVTTCTTTQAAGTVSQTCAPVAGRIRESIRIAGMPLVVKVSQLAGPRSVAVLERADSPRYRIAQPNGPGCDPICHVSAVDWAITKTSR
jgi:hypothetical protein